ncbi:hypothetical protein B7486_03655 [cyanobacterium TDX16]|nr:hypothetical protein B7486_03655 [cyanobacterium TDX16]
MTGDVNAPGLTVLAKTRGRALHLGCDNAVYACIRQAIFRSTDDGRSWQFVTRIPPRGLRGLLGTTRLGARLARHEIRACGRLGDGGLVACNREGVFFSRPNDPLMSPSRVPVGNQPLSPPMCIHVGPEDQVIWGEYDPRDAHGKPVRVYVSKDCGRTFEVAYVFDAGAVRHVHNFLFDRRLEKYWILVGDVNHEPGIGLLAQDFSGIEWIGRGEQKYRAVEVFDLGDRLVYGTDSEFEANRIVSLDKSTGKITEVRPIEGSCIYACRFGKNYAISTTVEPSRVNSSREAALYLSVDCDRWERVFSAEKDRWHPVLFQFGSMVLPRGASQSDTIIFSGQALRGIDNWVITAEWSGNI